MNLDAEIYIPGHGAPGGKPILIAMKHYLLELSGNVVKQIKKGSSLKETQDAVRPILISKFSDWKNHNWIDANIKQAYQEYSVELSK